MRQNRLTTDQAIIAVLIGAMNANAHISPAEGERAHNIIWSMRRFRKRSGEAVGRLIESVRDRMERDGVTPVLERAAGAIPDDLRDSVFAVAADLVLVDGRLEANERRFLIQLAGELGLRPQLAREILRVIQVKNLA